MKNIISFLTFDDIMSLSQTSKNMNRKVKKVYPKKFINTIHKKYYIDYKGHIQGLFRTYYDPENTKIYNKCIYRDNLLHGVSMVYKTDSTLIEKCHFIHGKIHGDYILYHECNNNVYRTGTYMYGKKNGEFLCYDITQRLIERIYYQDNKTIIKWYRDKHIQHNV